MWIKKCQKSNVLINDPRYRLKNPTFDPYSRTNNEEPRLPKPKDRWEASLGFGTNDRGSVPGVLTESGSPSHPDEVYKDSLTSGDYEDAVINEDAWGGKHERTENWIPYRWEKADPLHSGGSNSTSVSQTELDVRNNDYSPEEGAKRSYDEFLNRLRNPNRKARFRDYQVDVL